MTEALGTRGEFRLLHKIGEGGMADVFLAERLGDDGFRTRVALKRLHRGLAMDSYFIRQLVREARLLGQLEHNNIVKVFDLRRIGDEYYVVMEYVDGIDLAAVIKVHRSRKTRIPRPFFFHVALSLTEALAYAHNAVDPSGNPTPLIHRDIKPSNVMLSRRGIVKLTDFGIAHVGDGSVTGGLVQGTANYMSPEQAFGEERLTGASDVYSLGSVFYEMLTGRPLIDGDNYLKAIHQVRERRVSVEELAQLGVEPGLPVMAPAYDVGDGSMVLLAFAVPPEGNDIEEATLTLPLRVDDAAPNLHPRIASVRMDDDPVDDIVLAPEAEALLTVDLDPLAEEELDDDADVQWFTTVEESQGGGPGGRPGGFLGDDSLTLSSESKHQGVVVVVVRDGRGGVDWRELPVVVR